MVKNVSVEEANYKSISVYDKPDPLQRENSSISDSRKMKINLRQNLQNMILKYYLFIASSYNEL